MVFIFDIFILAQLIFWVCFDYYFDWVLAVKLTTMKEILHSNPNHRNNVVQSKLSAFVKNDESEKKNNNNCNDDDEYLIQFMTGRDRAGNAKHRWNKFTFEANDLTLGQQTWIKMMKNEVIQFVDSLFLVKQIRIQKLSFHPVMWLNIILIIAIMWYMLLF